MGKNNYAMRPPPCPMPLFLESLLAHRRLVFELAKRDVVGRYKGSFLGSLWSLVNPIVILALYTFVFGVIFKSRWTAHGSSIVEFAVVMFCGLILHGMVSEVLSRSPSLVTSQPNFVKKVVFPLDCLAWVILAAALYHFAVANVVMIVGVLLLRGDLPATALFAPLVVMPLALFLVGAAWILAALGVFFRDLSQVINIFLSVLLFLAPVFYPLSSVPVALRPLVFLNPLTLIVEQYRNVLIWGHAPDWAALGLYSVVAATVAWTGHHWFQKTRKDFADVL